MGLIKVPALILLIIFIVIIIAVLALLIFAGLINFKPKKSSNNDHKISKQDKPLGEQVKERQQKIQADKEAEKKLNKEI